MLLENVIKVLPEHRAARLREEHSLLHRGVQGSFEDAEDLTRADTSDSQGVGGSQ